MIIKNVMLATHSRQFFEIVYNFRNGEATLRQFINLVDTMGNALPTEEEQNKFKGDCLEILAEIFFKAFQNDPSVGLKDYTPVSIENDFGVDATGINANNQKVAVQVKYRHNPNDLVLYEEIAKTYASGELMLDLNLKQANSIYVFTTAIGLTPACQKVFGNKIKLINIDIIGDYIRNNTNFWNFAYEEVFNYLNQ